MPPPLSDAPGLSPRVRGKRFPVCWIVTAARSIPACAGEAVFLLLARRYQQVYPRVCGGSGRFLLQLPPRRGLSPRVRGKPGSITGKSLVSRSIPACAGEAPPAYARRAGLPVYPRVCGGSSWSFCCAIPFTGLSPRVRGKLKIGDHTTDIARSIPACAGEAISHPREFTLGGVYPRVCGGSPLTPSDPPTAAGLSPRVRGKPGQ